MDYEISAVTIRSTIFTVLTNFPRYLAYVKWVQNTEGGGEETWGYGHYKWI